MRKKNIYTFCVMILIFCGLVYFVWRVAFPYIFDSIRSVDRERIQKMRSIRIGMTEQDVVKILGEPDGIITDPEVKETHGSYGGGKEYGKVIKNLNKVLYYHAGVDYIGHYFIDQEGRVYFINVGGT